MARRHDPDPLLLQTVSERLARLLAEGAPGPAGPPGPGGAVAGDGGGSSSDVPPSAGRAGPDRGSDADLEPVDDLPDPPRFRRVHVGVVAVVLLAGLLWSGWSVLRARPVALAGPAVVAVSPTATAPPTAASATPASPAASTRGSPSPTTTGAAGPASRVVVHVLGAVRRPGLVTLPVPARVQDAVDAAGGFARGADAGELNLAQLLEDGQQVVIGTGGHPEGEVRGRTTGSAGGGGSGGGGAGPGPGGPRDQVLDLNQADASALEELPGVGPVTAAAIVAWREEHGRFSRAEELQEVDGIGPKTYAQIAPHVRV